MREFEEDDVAVIYIELLYHSDGTLRNCQGTQVLVIYIDIEQQVDVHSGFKSLQIAMLTKTRVFNVRIWKGSPRTWSVAFWLVTCSSPNGRLC